MHRQSVLDEFERAYYALRAEFAILHPRWMYDPNIAAKVGTLNHLIEKIRHELQPDDLTDTPEPVEQAQDDPPDTPPSGGGGFGKAKKRERR